LREDESVPPTTQNGKPRTLRSRVEELFDQAYDTGGIIERLRLEGVQFEDRSVIVMCSQLRLLGKYPKPRVPAAAKFSPMYVEFEEDLRKIYDLEGQERLIKAHAVLLHLARWAVNEDFLRFCPTLPPIGGV
jgi:hypothetical protein